MKLTIKQLKQLIKEQIAGMDIDSVEAPVVKSSLEDMLDQLIKDTLKAGQSSTPFSTPKTTTRIEDLRTSILELYGK